MSSWGYQSPSTKSLHEDGGDGGSTDERVLKDISKLLGEVEEKDDATTEGLTVFH
jgi:hypothetical protein